MNSTAAIKAFTGRNGGTICTSSNARQSLEWAFEQGERVFFLPDQHLGRNTAVLELGLSLDDCVALRPAQARRRADRRAAARGEGGAVARALLGARPVHRGGRRRGARAHPRGQHPGAPRVPARGGPQGRLRRLAPSTSSARSTPPSPAPSWAIGTELNLVRRLANAHPDKQVTFLDRSVCYCSTMNRIDLPHLVWALENLAAGNVVNQIVVDADTEHWARVALDRMLALPGWRRRRLSACRLPRSPDAERHARAESALGPTAPGRPRSGTSATAPSPPAGRRAPGRGPAARASCRGSGSPSAAGANG